MLELESARARILAAIAPGNTEQIGLAEAYGRILREPIFAPRSLPTFDNSAMDGYAVHAAELAQATPEAPAILTLAERIKAGDRIPASLPPGSCARVFTGSPLPPGADAVVMQEATRLDPRKPGKVSMLVPVGPGENVRKAGEDVQGGAEVFSSGDCLHEGGIGLLAALGLTHLEVGRAPVAGLLATGSELREPGEPLPAGCIYESNRALLAPLVVRAGALPKVFPLVPDNLHDTRLALAKAFRESDLIITTGGVSVGEMDYTKKAFEDLGGTLQFWRVAIKPGKPFVFGKLENKFLFGLPGNPVSAFVTFLLLVWPALRRWQGAADLELPSHPGILAEPLANEGDRRHFMRVGVDAQGHVRSTGLQGSHVLSSLARANGLVDVPPGKEIPAGSTVQVLRCEW